MISFKMSKSNLYISQNSGSYCNGVNINLKDIDSETLDKLIAVLADEYTRRDI